MGNKLKQVRHRRIFSESLKKQIVKEYEQGKYGIKELERIYQVSNPSIYNWIYKYSQYQKKSIFVVEMKASQTEKIKNLEARVKELEQAVGVKQMNIDFLEKMIEITKEEYDIDIKKNSNTPQSNGSGKIKQS
jgi:transposase-like protein